jgi:hypothetical protein
MYSKDYSVKKLLKFAEKFDYKFKSTNHFVYPTRYKLTIDGHDVGYKVLGLHSDPK